MDYEFFVPTPDAIITAKLEFAQIQPGETVFDLGCGDGKVLIQAALKYNARGVGIEVREDLVDQARERMAQENLMDRIEIRQQDFRVASVAEADVLIIYLNRGSLGQLSRKLEEELHPGACIVTHEFDMPGWSAEKEEEILTPEGVTTTLFRYRVSNF